MAKDPQREMLENTVVAIYNKMIDAMTESGKDYITKDEIIELRTEFKGRMDLSWCVKVNVVEK